MYTKNYERNVIIIYLSYDSLFIYLDYKIYFHSNK